MKRFGCLGEVGGHVIHCLSVIMGDHNNASLVQSYLPRACVRSLSPQAEMIFPRFSTISAYPG
jgi:hypothetical protein